jgi:hypothetical protein
VRRRSKSGLGPESTLWVEKRGVDGELSVTLNSGAHPINKEYVRDEASIKMERNVLPRSAIARITTWTKDAIFYRNPDLEIKPVCSCQRSDGSPS